MMKFAQALRRMRREDRGFTLVELMVVVVIIGVLAAVAIPKFSGIIDNSKQKSDIATGKTIKDSVDRYYVDKGVYTADLATLVTDGYLNSTPKVAQGDGSATNTDVFKISVVGQVTVYQVDGSTVTATEIWNSAS